MNENLNLSKILRDCLKGTKLYSPLFGVVKFEEISEDWNFVCVRKGKDIWTFTYDARFLFGISNSKSAEIMLFPSKEQRDWSKFITKQSEMEELCESQEITKWAYINDLLPKQPKFDPNTLKPFDKVLVRLTKDGIWNVTFFSHYDKKVMWGCYPFVTTSSKSYSMCIPYNDKTKHLVGTSDEAPEFYRYWED